ncbi:MAG: hypothetical protein KAI06_03125 [Anaerolineales bacterium]|nr:hypothetical protein [Anaerolineales bacterium]
MDWFDNFIFVPMIVLFLTGSALAIFKPSPRLIPVLAVQYISVSWLAYTSLPAVGAYAKLITGFLVCVILYLGIRQIGDGPFTADDQPISANLSFRVIALLLVSVASVSVARSNLFAQFDITVEANVSASFLIASSLLNLGLGSDHLRTGIGLLTLISGGELIYSFIEPSLAVIALLAMVHLGIVLVFSYIISVQARYGTPEKHIP